MDTTALPRFASMFVFTLAACNQSASTQGYLSASAEGDLRFADVSQLRYDTELDAACGSGRVTALGRGEMPRWPYLQKVGPDTAEVLFTATTDRAYRVVVTSAEGDAIGQVDAV